MPGVSIHSSSSPQPEARGRWLQAGCRAVSGCVWGSSLGEPTSHLGCKGNKTTVGQGPAGFRSTAITPTTFSLERRPPPREHVAGAEGIAGARKSRKGIHV